jgi:2-iminobutanoate/2-iminopropanoate deaminase
MRPEHVVVGRGSTMGTSGSADPVIADAVRWGNLVFLSGRAPVDPATLKVVSGGFEDQAQVVLRDVGAVLDRCGSSWDQVIRVETFLADAADFPAWNRIWSEHFPPPRPARTTVVCGFAVPGMLIELQVTAGIQVDS